MKKTLIFIIPVRQKENGMLFIKNMKSLCLAVNFLKDSYEITLLVRAYREKTIPDITNLGVRVFYETSEQNQKMDFSESPSRFQLNYHRWVSRESLRTVDECYLAKVLPDEYDRLIAWDGCSPWCLATAMMRVPAKKRFLWIQDDPQWYLMTEDHPFFAEACKSFNKVMVSNGAIKPKVDAISNALTHEVNGCVVVRLPVDTHWYLERSAQPIACDFCKDEIHIMVVSRMSKENNLERLPELLYKHRDNIPQLHCWIFGDGNRLDRYIQQIAVFELDSMITLFGQVDNPYPYLRSCDMLVLCEDEFQENLKIAAEIFGVPTICFEELERRLPGLMKKKEQDRQFSYTWEDREKLINILGLEGK